MATQMSSAQDEYVAVRIHTALVGAGDRLRDHLPERGELPVERVPRRDRLPEDVDVAAESDRHDGIEGNQEQRDEPERPRQGEGRPQSPRRAVVAGLGSGTGLELAPVLRHSASALGLTS